MIENIFLPVFIEACQLIKVEKGKSASVTFCAKLIPLKGALTYTNLQMEITDPRWRLQIH